MKKMSKHSELTHSRDVSDRQASTTTTTSEYAVLSKYDITTVNGEKHTTIMDLNEDCLWELFDYFNIIDLLSLSKVCKRFSIIVHSLVARKFGSFDLKETTTMENLIIKPFQKLAVLSELFQCFGRYVTELTLPTLRGEDDEEYCDSIFLDIVPILKMVARNCRNLKVLDVLHYSFSNRGNVFEMSAIHKLFGQLTALRIRKAIFAASFDVHQSILRYCDNLKSLTYIEADSTNLYAWKLPNLIEFSTIIFFNGEQTQFFRRLKRIERLHLGIVYLLPPDLCRFNCYQNVKVLHLDLCFVFGPRALYNFVELIEMLATINKIEELKLCGCNSDEDEFLPTLLRCTNLTSLEIKPKWRLNDETLILLARHMPNLAKMYINQNSSVTSAGLMRFIDDCKNLMELKLPVLAKFVDIENIILKIANTHKTRESGQRFVLVVDDEGLRDITQTFDSSNLRDSIKFMTGARIGAGSDFESNDDEDSDSEDSDGEDGNEESDEDSSEHGEEVD